MDNAFRSLIHMLERDEDGVKTKDADDAQAVE